MSWRDGIVHFSPAWFTVTMGTGAIHLCLINFPYPLDRPAQWMRNLGYCFWIFAILQFVLFTAILATRYIKYPTLMKKTIVEFPGCSLLGAIPIALGPIIQGILSYYSARPSARWTAFAFFWFDVGLTLFVCLSVLFYQMMKQKSHSLNDVVGVWILTVVPMIETSATGGDIAGHIGPQPAVGTLLTSFMLWSAGLTLIYFIIAIYFWRLIVHKVPAAPQVASSFVPVAPLSVAAAAIHEFSTALSAYLKSSDFVPTPISSTSETQLAIAAVIYWAGVLTALGLLAHATFWLLQATTAIFWRMPKKFGIGVWALVFPWASYSNAISLLGRDLRNNGLRGWGALHTVITVLLWLFCAALTIYYVGWKHEVIDPPGSKQWIAEKQSARKRNDDMRNNSVAGDQVVANGSADGNANEMSRERTAAGRPPAPDGQEGASIQEV